MKTLPTLIATSDVRGSQQGESHGGIYLVDFENQVAEIVAMANAAGAVTCVDGVSMAPHGLPDISALGADIYLFSSYKTY